MSQSTFYDAQVIAWVFFFAALVLWTVHPAHAQQPRMTAQDQSGVETQELADEQAQAQALLLYERAELHYRSGEFERASLLLREAMDLVDAAPMHFNLARSLYEMGVLEESLAEYGRFLELDPESDQRPLVEARIGQITAEIRARDIQLSPTPLPPAEPAEERNEPMPQPTIIAPWILLISAALPLGAAVVTGVLFQEELNDARSAATHQLAGPHVESADRYAVATNVLYGVGGALAVAGLVWGVATLVGGDDEPSVQVSIGPTSMLLRGSF